MSTPLLSSLVLRVFVIQVLAIARLLPAANADTQSPAVYRPYSAASSTPYATVVAGSEARFQLSQSPPGFVGPRFAIGLANLAPDGIVPSNYRARVIDLLLKTQEYKSDEGWDYRIKFSPPAYAFRDGGKQVVGAVRFLVISVPPKTKGVLYNIGSFPEIAVFTPYGAPLIVSDVQWLFGEPEFDQKLSAESIFAVHQTKAAAKRN